MLAQLWHGARRMGVAAQLDARLRNRGPRILLASLAMGGCLWVAAQLLHPYLQLPFLRYLALFGLVMIGIVSYFGVGTLIGAFRLSDFKTNMRRKKS
jgi:putative peptidoglycan lipid II flippase